MGHGGSKMQRSLEPSGRGKAAVVLAISRWAMATLAPIAAPIPFDDGQGAGGQGRNQVRPPGREHHVPRPDEQRQVYAEGTEHACAVGVMTMSSADVKSVNKG